MRRIYGRHIATFKWNDKGESGLQNCTLEVYKTVSMTKLVLWDSSISGWREKKPKMTSYGGKSLGIVEVMKCMNVPAYAECQMPPIRNYGTIDF